jgi:hypothetical protein
MNTTTLKIIREMHLNCNHICNIIQEWFTVSQKYLYFSLHIISDVFFNFLHIQVEKWKKRLQFACCFMFLNLELDDSLLSP